MEKAFSKAAGQAHKASPLPPHLLLPEQALHPRMMATLRGIFPLTVLPLQGQPLLLAGSLYSKLLSDLPSTQDSSSMPSSSDPPPLAPPAQIPEAFETILTRAIREGFAQCLQQIGLPAGSTSLPQHSLQGQLEDQLSEHELEDYEDAADHVSISEHEEVPESALSDDEGLIPDQSPFICLFKPQMFRSLLFKAIATTRLGEFPSTAAAPSTDPATALFAEPTVAPETILAPKLFLDVLHRHWGLPGAGPSPNNLDKRLYNPAPALADLLQPPIVDPPIVALANPVHPTGPPEDSL